jgi:hypothetical protein
MEKLNFENIGEVFNKVTDTPEWEELQAKFNHCSDIFILGHGGNLAVADHASADISRLSNGTKNAQAPGSAIVASTKNSFIHRRTVRQITRVGYFIIGNFRRYN